MYNNFDNIINLYINIMKIMEIIAYVVGLIVLLYVMDRYFSGAKYNGNKPNLTGYLAVITGGNSGIGK